MLSSERLDAYRSALDEVSAGAGDYLKAIFEEAYRLRPEMTVAEWREFAIAATQAAAETYGDMGAELACQLYDSQVAASGYGSAAMGATLDQQRAEKVVRYQARKLVEGDFEGFAQACASFVSNHVREFANSTMVYNWERSAKSTSQSRSTAKTGNKGVSFARVPTGHETCTFCIMLASRGFVYWSRETAGEFNHYHRNCKCLVIPDDGSGEVEGYDPAGLHKLWEAYEEIDAREGLSESEKRAAKRMLSSTGADAELAVAFTLRPMLSDSIAPGYIAAGSIYANSSTDLYRYAAKVKPLDGYYDVAIHGNGRGFAINDANDKSIQDVTATDLAATLANDRRYEGGPVRLLSCNAGQYSDGIAQEVSDILGVEVLAPTQAVNIDSVGNMVLSDDETFADMAFKGIIKEPGKWISFFPNGSHS